MVRRSRFRRVTQSRSAWHLISAAAYALLGLALFGRFLGPTTTTVEQPPQVRSPSGRYELILEPDPQAGWWLTVHDHLTGQSETWINWPETVPGATIARGWLADDGRSMVLMSAFTPSAYPPGGIGFYTRHGLHWTILYIELCDGRWLFPLEASGGLSRRARVQIADANMDGTLLHVRTTGLCDYAIDVTTRRIVERTINWRTVLRWVLYAALIVPAPIHMANLARCRISTWRARHRRRAGRCWKCCYDLTGNVSGRCPECGTEAGHRAEGAG